MDYFESVRTRRSVRAYKADPVEREKIDKILEAARLAPTACNFQPFRVIVLETAGREAELRRIYDKPWFVSAPCIFHVCALPGDAWKRRDGKNYADVDATIAMEHLILAATALGLGSCWIANFDPAAAREVLKLAPGWEPLAFTPIGYPAETPAERARKGLGDLVVRL
jgi:nitroreductase